MTEDDLIQYVKFWRTLAFQMMAVAALAMFGFLWELFTK